MRPILDRLSDPVKYGLTMFVAVWFVGWIMGQGSFLANLIFSALIGVFAGGLFWLLKRYFRKRP